MKKFISLFLIIVLCFCFSSGYAVTKKEILFRNLPWGSSPTEVKRSFSEPVLWDSPIIGGIFGIGYWTTGEGTVYSGDVSEEIRSSLYGSTRVSVAGMKASMVVLRFAKVPGEEPALIMGEYLFATGNTSDIYFSLQDKLYNLYGRSDESSVAFTTRVNLYTSWKDEEGNFVSLWEQGDTIVSVRYISAKMDDLLSAAANKYQQEQFANYDGL
jgi:hypothetical protein